MEIKVPLPRFTQYLQDAAKVDEEYPCLKQQEWLVSNWSFSDREAVYEPQPTAWPSLEIRPAMGPFMSWWRELARN